MAANVSTPSWTGTKIANCEDLGTKVLKWVRLDLDMNDVTVYDWDTGFDYVLFAIVQNNEVASVGVESPNVFWNALNDGTAGNGKVGITSITVDNNFHCFAVGF
jgi:hypothetical protein